MLAAIRSEIYKLLTIRFIYGLAVFLLGVIGLFAFYVTGWHTAEESFLSPDFMQNNIMSAVHTIGLAIGLISILLVTHEYRYNTIVYSLTANKSRAQVFFAKFLVASVFSILLTFILAVLTVVLSSLAIGIRGFELSPQSFMYGQLLWSVALISWGYGAFAFIIAMLIRSQVGAIVVMFLMSSTIEPLLGIVLKSNQSYLPYTALTGIYGFGLVDGPATSTLVIAVLINIVLWLSLSLFMFVRRDAN